MQPQSPAPGRHDALRPRTAHPRQQLNSRIMGQKLRREEPPAPTDDAAWDDDHVYELGPDFPDDQDGGQSNGER